MTTNLFNASGFHSQAPIDDDLDGLITVDELASLLKVPKSWIYQHTRKRGLERLPHIKLGKYLRFFESEVRTFLHHQSRRRSA